MSRKKLCDLDAFVIAETDKAWLLETDKGRAWVPKSQVEKNDDDTFTMTEELAVEKELV